MLHWIVVVAAALAQQGPDPERARLEREIAVLDKTIKGDAGDLEARMARGRACFKLGRMLHVAKDDATGALQKAIGDFEVVKDRKREDDLPRVWRGYSYLCLAEHEISRGQNPERTYLNSKGEFDEAWTINQNRTETFVGRGQVYLGQGTPECLDCALDNFNRAVALDPRRPVLYQLRARTLDALNRAEEAKVERLIADRLKPQEAQVMPELEREIDDLIVRLGDEAYDVRLKASERLIEIGKAAKPQLEKALHHADPEVVQRAEEALRSVLRQEDVDGLFVPMN